MKNNLRLFAFLFLPAVGLAQNLANDSIQVNKYLKEADKSKTIPRMFTITDPAKVAQISNYIDAKSKIVKDAEDREKAEKAKLPGIRYKNGDKTAIPEIVTILKSNDSTKIEDVLLSWQPNTCRKTKHVNSNLKSQRRFTHCSKTSRPNLMSSSFWVTIMLKAVFR